MTLQQQNSPTLLAQATVLAVCESEAANTTVCAIIIFDPVVETARLMYPSLTGLTHHPCFIFLHIIRVAISDMTDAAWSLII